MKENKRVVTEKEEKQENVFSRREEETLKLIAEAYTSKQIADKLELSKRTIDHYRINICKKLNIKGTAYLIKAAIEYKAYIDKHKR